MEKIRLANGRRVEVSPIHASRGSVSAAVYEKHSRTPFHRQVFSTDADAQGFVGKLSQHDDRYVVQLEFCGEPKAKYVVRFCGDWVGYRDTKIEAMMLASEHNKQRMN